MDSAALAPLDQTFRLHSRPGALRKIYLDFNGHTTTGALWNQNYTGGANIVTPPFDIDGNPASFSTTELERIQYIWQRVVEDYAPFDVDVTTEDPGVEGLRKTTSTDLAYGTRVVIGGSSYDWFGAGAGGVAYIGRFNWSSDTPCFVWPAQLGAGNEKYVAEAISHEAGHTVALYHDGKTDGTAYYSGHGDWAPIMGVGYYKSIVQWSKGEYSLANNTQDDLAVIQSYVPYRPDDHGNWIGAATILTGPTLQAQGVIERNTDVDVFGFVTGAGVISLSVATDPRSPTSMRWSAFTMRLETWSPMRILLPWGRLLTCRYRPGPTTWQSTAWGLEVQPRGIQTTPVWGNTVSPAPSSAR